MTDITGFGELTPYKGGWCGNDVFVGGLKKERAAVQRMAKKLGNRLYKEGYRGAFCMDFLIDTDTGDVYLGELNPRVSGASPPTHLITSTYGGVPLFLFHLLEFMDIDYEIDLEAIQNRWKEFDEWSQLILKHPGDEVELISKAPASGIWRMGEDGSLKFVRRTLDWTNVDRRERGLLSARLHRRRLPLPRRRHGHPGRPRPHADRRPPAPRPRQEVGRRHQRPVPVRAAAAGNAGPSAAGGFGEQDVLRRFTQKCFT